MHCLGVSWALNLGAHSSHYLLSIITSLHFISSHWLYYSSRLLYSVCCFVLHHFFPTPSGDPPQFITWRVVMSFPLSILRTLIQGSLVWESHIIRESLCYIDIWEHVYPFLTSSLWLLGLRSEHVYLYICKKKWKK